MSFKFNKKLFIINIIIFTIIYLVFDIYYFSYILGKENILQNKTTKTIEYLIKYIKRYDINYLDDFESKYIKRTKANREVKERYLTNPTSTEQPIIILGCSYAYGQHLDKQSAFSGQLAKLTNRPVYNLAHIAGSIQHAIYQLKNDFIQNDIKNPKYVIYVYMNDHINRLYNSCGYTILDYIFYKEKNNKLEIDKLYSYINRLPIPFIINTTLNLNFEKSEEKRTEFLKKHISELNTQIKKNWNNTEFIIFSYYNTNELNSLSTYLKENNIKYIQLDTILEKNNITYDDSFKLPESIDRFRHPSSKAWEIITPLLLNEIDRDNI